MRNNSNMTPRSRKSSSSSSSGGGAVVDIEQGNNSHHHQRSSPIRSLDPPSFSDVNNNLTTPSSFSLLRKLFNDLVSKINTTNDPTTTTTTTTTTTATCSSLLKDTILGVSLGILFLLLLFLLDYHNILSIGSTKAFQSAGIQLLNDPDVLSTIESSLHIKLLPMDAYNAMTTEITSNLQLVQENSSSTVYANTLVQLTSEQQTLQNEINDLTSKVNVKFGLDKWCGSCSGGWGNCDNRVAYLKDKYGSAMVQAKVNLMKEGNCIQK